MTTVSAVTTTKYRVVVEDGGTVRVIGDVTSALSAALSAADAADSATTAAASASAAASSATSASASATTATTQAGAASTSATAAAASASAASSSATAAASSATSASASATSATASATTATNQAAAAAASALSAASVVSQDLSAIDRTVFAATIVDAFLYDTSKDSDGGAWRKRCSHTSWENETLSGNWLGSAANETAARAISGATTGSYYYDTTAAAFYTLNAGSGKTATYRGNVRQFPAQVLITVEAARVVIWDLTQAGCPMWMVFSIATTVSISCATMLNGLFVFGSNGTTGYLWAWDFPSAKPRRWYGGGYQIGISWVTTIPSYTSFTSPAIVSNYVNDVAMTVLPNAPVDVATGLPIPVIDVFTDAGTSRINSDGTVADLVDTAGDDHKAGCILASGDSVALNSTNGNVDIYKLSNTLADTLTPDRTYDQATVPALLEAVDAGDKIVAMKHRFAVGQDNGVNVLIENPASVAAGMVAYMTKDYNSGWQVGAIKGAWLADSVAETKTGGTDTDRSVKANDLTVNGSLTKAAVASGAQLVGYSGFSVANYLDRAYDADFDFGTGNFCIGGWIKPTANGAVQQVVSKGAYSGSYSGSLMSIYMDGTCRMFAYLSDDGAATYDQVNSTGAYADGAWHLVLMLVRSAVLELWVDGVLLVTAAVSNANLGQSNASAKLIFGCSLAGTSPLHASTALALWRASATAPTAEQIKHIYETEKPMFAASAQCCLAGTSNAVTALAFDDETDLLHVGTSYGRSAFKGLVRVSSEATPVGAITALAAGAGVIAQGGATAVDVYVPAYTLREELLRDAEQMARFGQNLVAHDFTATASQTTFTLPVGWEIVAVYQQGAIKRETTSWTRSFDGFKWSAVLGTGATVSDWISILAKRV